MSATVPITWANGVTVDYILLNTELRDALNDFRDGTGMIKVARIPAAIAAGSLIATGTATLVAGTVTIANTSITANSVIRVANKTIGGTPGALFISAKTAGTSFKITSSNVADTSLVQYDIVTY